MDKMDKADKGDHNEIQMDVGSWNFVKLDDVWHFMGRFSKYQLFQIVLMQSLILSMALPILSGMFTGKLVDYRCALDNTSIILDQQNRSVEVSACNVQVIDNESSQVLSSDGCQDYIYEGGETTLSYLAEWDLVCDKETLGQLPQILTMVGQLFGASILPYLGDTYGRKKFIIVSNIFMFVLSLAPAFVEQFEVFLVLKFLIGAVQQSCYIVMFTATVEVMPLEQASFVSFLTSSVWVVSMINVGIIGYLLRTAGWRTIQLVMAMATLPALLCLFFLDESLRWLLGNNKEKEAEQILHKVCRINKKDYNQLMDTVADSSKDTRELVSPVSHFEVTDEVTKQVNAKTILFKNKNMRLITFVMCYAWMIDSMTYYGLTLLSTSLAGDPYANYFLTALVDIPSACAMYYALQKFGRKQTTIASNIIAGTALLLTVLVAQFAPPLGGYIILRTCLTLIGKFFITCSFNTVWIYASELYPTNLRSVGIGISSSAARIGASFSPLFTILARKFLWAPGVLFGSACYISVVLLAMLPETRWRELPQNVQEIDGWFEKDKMTRASRNDDEDD